MLWIQYQVLLGGYAPGYINNDALSFIVGYVNDEIRIGYSYDFTISRLSTHTGGAHEIALVYEFNQEQKPRKKKQAGACSV